MSKICNTCRHWKVMPELNIRGQKVSTGEMICARSDEDASPVYGQDGKAIVTEATFGCNRWEQ